ncbi:hypothetical protein ACIQUQ_34125 [Streptomyces sp. NPDC101118]|uniref:hypothetical protein n=1 Tax=Streptomyces sp. NPDC101118 TaxID=3366109 RepID=UPI00380A56B2
MNQQGEADDWWQNLYEDFPPDDDRTARGPEDTLDAHFTSASRVTAPVPPGPDARRPPGPAEVRPPSGEPPAGRAPGGPEAGAVTGETRGSGRPAAGEGRAPGGPAPGEPPRSAVAFPGKEVPGPRRTPAAAGASGALAAPEPSPPGEGETPGGGPDAPGGRADARPWAGDAPESGALPTRPRAPWEPPPTLPDFSAGTTGRGTWGGDDPGRGSGPAARRSGPLAPGGDASGGDTSGSDASGSDASGRAADPRASDGDADGRNTRPAAGDAGTGGLPPASGPGRGPAPGSPPAPPVPPPPPPAPGNADAGLPWPGYPDAPPPPPAPLPRECSEPDPRYGPRAPGTGTPEPIPPNPAAGAGGGTAGTRTGSGSSGPQPPDGRRGAGAGPDRPGSPSHPAPGPGSAAGPSPARGEGETPATGPDPRSVAPDTPSPYGASGAGAVPEGTDDAPQAPRSGAGPASGDTVRGSGAAPGLPAQRTGPPEELPPLPPPPAEPRPHPGRPAVRYLGDRPPTYEGEPGALPVADPAEPADLVPDTVLEGARYGRYTLRAASVRGDSARYRGEARRDFLLTARFGRGDDALLLVALAGGDRATTGAPQADAELCRWIAGAVGRSQQRLGADIRAGRRDDLRSGLQRLTDRGYGRLRALGHPQPTGLRCMLLPIDPECRTRVVFGAGEGGLFRLRGGVWEDLEPARADQPFRFRASVAESGDTLLVCTGGLADPMRDEPLLPEALAGRWGPGSGGAPGLAAFLADSQLRVKGYADDRTAAALWES